MNVFSNRRGAVAAVSAVVMVAVLGFAGLAVDLTRIWMVNARLKTAIDAASLVGARQISMPEATRDAQIQAIYWANISHNGRNANYMGATIQDAVIQQIDDSRIQVTGRADVPTTLFSIINRRDMPIVDSAIARRQGTGLELALVLDVTGSMAAGNNIGALRTAATNLVNTLFAGQDEQPNLWVSVVPYTAMVNIGTGRQSWLQAPVNPADYAPTVWRGCVEARVGGTYPADADATDDPPRILPFQPFLWRSNRFDFSLDANIPGNVWVYRAAGIPTAGGVPTAANNTTPSYPTPISVPLNPALPNGVRPTDVPVNRGDNAWIPGPGGTVVADGPADFSVAVWEPNPEAPGPDEAAGGLDNQRRGPNVGCGRAVLPLTADRRVIQAQIDALRATRRGGTMANLGLQLGWGTISPRWREDWNLTANREGQQLPLDYNTRFMEKAIVLMTDGDNQWFDWGAGAPGACTIETRLPPRAPGPCASATNPTAQPGMPVWTDPPAIVNADQNAYGRLADGRLGIVNPTPGVAGTAATNVPNGINARMAALCQAVQAENRNITVYTIVFAANPSVALQNLYRGCASAPENFFIARDQDGLLAAFATIAGQLAALSLVQ